MLMPCPEVNGFRLSAEDLERAITPQTRWLMLNSPSNPSGAAYSQADYRPIPDVLLRHPQVWPVADDMYEHIVYDDFRFVTPAAIEPRLRDRTMTVNGVSKAPKSSDASAGPRSLSRRRRRPSPLRSVRCGSPRFHPGRVKRPKPTRITSSVRGPARTAGHFPVWQGRHMATRPPAEGYDHLQRRR